MRKQARETAFKLVFEYLFLREVNEDSLRELCFGADDEDVAYTAEVYRGVVRNFAALEETLKANMPRYDYSRVYKTDKAILLLAAYEILHREDVPAAVSVNEAVELAKKYCAEKSPVFVNGVLAGVISGAKQPA